MRRLLKAFFAKPLVIYLAVALIAASSVAGPAEAMYLRLGPGSAPDASSAYQNAEMATIQKTLETEVIRQRLEDLGLSSGEVLAKLSTLTDEQVHQLASRIDAVQAGGRGGSIDASTLIIILLLVLLILILVENAAEPQVHMG
ncbi:MAG TPA: PA2779 family protein [Nitrospirota bacterium]